MLFKFTSFIKKIINGEPGLLYIPKLQFNNNVFANERRSYRFMKGRKSSMWHIFCRATSILTQYLPLLSYTDPVQSFITS